MLDRGASSGALPVWSSAVRPRKASVKEPPGSSLLALTIAASPTAHVLAPSLLFPPVSLLPPSLCVYSDMASTPFRWRLPNRKSSTPFFPGAWPNSSAVQDTDTTRSVAAASTPDVRDMASSGESRQDMLSAPTKAPRQSRKPSEVFTSSGTATRSGDKQLHHIDHVTNFHRRISHSLESSQSSPLDSSLFGSGLPSGGNLTDSSRHGSTWYMVSHIHTVEAAKYRHARNTRNVLAPLIPQLPPQALYHQQPHCLFLWYLHMEQVSPEKNCFQYLALSRKTVS